MDKYVQLNQQAYIIPEAAQGDSLKQEHLVSEKASQQVVRALAPQGYDTRINVRIVPGANLKDKLKPKKCEPRKGAPRREVEPMDLPADVIDKMRKADKQVVAWLAKDKANARLFMANPAVALAQAGVDLDRAALKAIHRSHQAVRETAVVAPGVRVEEIDAEAFPTSRVGKIQPNRKPHGKSGSGCAKED